MSETISGQPAESGSAFPQFDPAVHVVPATRYCLECEARAKGQGEGAGRMKQMIDVVTEKYDDQEHCRKAIAAFASMAIQNMKGDLLRFALDSCRSCCAFLDELEGNPKELV